MERITSRRNPVVTEFRALFDPSRARCDGGGNSRMLLDGAHLIEEALEAGIVIDVVAVRDGLAAAQTALAHRAAARGARLITVPDALVPALSPVRQPSGIVAIARQRSCTLDAALESLPQLVLILSEIQDPGNVGAIIRAAEACGATGIVTTERTADPFGWKALRGSMGSSFRLPVAVRQPLEAVLDRVNARGIRLYAAVPRGGRPLPQTDLRSATAVLLGGEGAGLPDRLLSLADATLSIPMRPAVESLNVATAAALITYEAQRQREGYAP